MGELRSNDASHIVRINRSKAVVAHFARNCPFCKARAERGLCGRNQEVRDVQLNSALIP